MSETTEPVVTMYESTRGGAVRDTLSGLTLSPAPDEAGVWLVRTGPSFAPFGFRPLAGDRFRDTAGEWWTVESVGETSEIGTVKLNCKMEG